MFKYSIDSDRENLPDETDFSEWEFFLEQIFINSEIYKKDEKHIWFKIGNFNEENNEWGKDFIVLRITQMSMAVFYMQQASGRIYNIPFLFALKPYTEEDFKHYINFPLGKMRHIFHVPGHISVVIPWVRKHYPQFLK